MSNIDVPHSNVGYCLKRKMAKSVYGYVYKGVILKRRKVHVGEEVILNNQLIDGSKRRHLETARIGSSSNICRKQCTNSLERIVEDFSSQSTQSTSTKESHDVAAESDANYIWEDTGQLVAIKTSSWAQIQQMRGKHLEDPLKEIEALQLLGDYHKNIISNIDALQDNINLYCVLPYCSQGDLYGVVQREITGRGRLYERTGRYWFRKILRALHHLQLKGVCHRDLALENILVHGQELKLIDFGMALRVPYSDPRQMRDMDWTVDVSEGGIRRLMVAQGQGGKWDYMAPEIVSRETSFDGFAIDLWATGVILYIMLIGHKPFHWAHSSDLSFRRLAMEGRLRETLVSWKIDLSENASDLLQNMLWKDPRRRFTLSQVMEHRWVKNETRTDEMADVDRLFGSASVSSGSPDGNQSQSSNESRRRRKLSRIWSRNIKKKS